jgi:hypothetical protein
VVEDLPGAEVDEEPAGAVADEVDVAGVLQHEQVLGQPADPLLRGERRARAVLC